MARKITRVCKKVVSEVHGARRVHRAGSRTCIFCANDHAQHNALPDTSATATTTQDNGVDIPGTLDNTILRNDTTVTVLSVSLPHHAALNLIAGEEDLDLAPPAVPSVHAFTLRLTHSLNPDAAARSPSHAWPDSYQRYSLLMTFYHHSDTALP